LGQSQRQPPLPCEVVEWAGGSAAQPHNSRPSPTSCPAPSNPSMFAVASQTASVPVANCTARIGTASGGIEGGTQHKEFVRESDVEQVQAACEARRQELREARAVLARGRKMVDPAEPTLYASRRRRKIRRSVRFFAVLAAWHTVREKSAAHEVPTRDSSLSRIATEVGRTLRSE
jgi:hypothetical protein